MIPLVSAVPSGLMLDVFGAEWEMLVSFHGSGVHL